MRAARYTSYNQQNGMLDWSDKTILVAEDVPANYMLIEAILSKTGVKLIWARDGQEAVDKCEETIRAAGISKVLNKPISPELLMFSIQEFFRQ